ncbi:cobalamin biosynthesis protein CobQ [Sphingomonas sp. Leaf22]|uniref:cobyric acid synthase n=1 Tax=Sphingomonas sp. Leaf22 TaxID=1735687 RepID=UPI0006FFC5B8|nr:cobyric acid synthase [Sphingomonas sp. Leaf22]KQM76181.1 cobalamin biosynthesis protein CobQ [Sphingomonas sp. Leaf22]
MAAVMIQGTGSDVGKSVLVAGLCRLLTDRGLRVRPFKAQNMSNNAAVCADGGEIGRAQALQAMACRVPPTTTMNPVLLKPQSDRTSQLVVGGRVAGTMAAGDYRRRRPELLAEVLAAYRRLSADADIVVVEGAGSPAEINLRAGDIANMGFARAAGVPVVLAGDIDRGGVIAALVGTQAVIDPQDAAMIRGFLVNKFRGDPALFDDGRAEIVARTGWRDIGLVTWLADAARLPAEDAVALGRGAERGEGPLIAVPMLSRIANFDDFDALAHDPAVRLRMIPPGQPLPGDAALVILPGTKATIADLAFLREQGWDIDLAAHVRRGGQVLGICGGYQMLGASIADPDGIEGPAGRVAGLGLLPIDTVIAGVKTTRPITGTLVDGAAFAGYEIHAGVTTVAPGAPPLLRFADGTPDGAVARDGQIAGCYVHGLFDAASARASLLRRIGAQADPLDRREGIDAALDGVARALEAALDIDALLDIAGEAP